MYRKIELKHIIIFGTIALLTVSVFYFKPMKKVFVIPESDSVKGNLFLLQDKNTPNDYVVFEYDKMEYKSYTKGKLFIKKMGCSSGQHLVVKNRQVTCDRKIIATMFEKNSEGNILPKYEYDGVIANNQFFALGEHPRSFDSRYFGLVDKAQIRHTAKRIF